jgi:transcriptional regulator with XRE-family HTH domain
MTQAELNLEPDPATAQETTDGDPPDSEEINENQAESKSDHVDRKLDLSKAITYRIKNNMTYEEIGERLGVTKQAVHRALKKLIPRDENQDYKKYRGDILSQAQIPLITAIVDPKRIKKANINNLGYAFTQLYNAERLERGLSTENVNIHERLEDVQKINTEISRLESEIARLLEPYKE